MSEFERHIQAMDKINALLNVRERNCKEVRERLAKSGFTESEIEKAVDAAVACGLLDETRYAHAYIRGKVHSGWGKTKIIMKLKQDGISDEVIQQCEGEFPGYDEEVERALHELKKKPSRSKDPYASYMRRLVSKGYSFDIAKRAVEELKSGS